MGRFPEKIRFLKTFSTNIAMLCAFVHFVTIVDAGTCNQSGCESGTRTLTLGKLLKNAPLGSRTKNSLYCFKHGSELEMCPACDAQMIPESGKTAPRTLLCPKCKYRKEYSKTTSFECGDFGRRLAGRDPPVLIRLSPSRNQF